MLRNLCFRWREFKMPPTPIITKQDIINAGIQLISLDAADRGAIGGKIVLSGKRILSRKSLGFPW